MNFVFATIVLTFVSFSLGTIDTVLELNDLTFDEALEKNPIILVLFYASWATDTKKLLGELEAATKLVKTLNKPYVLAKIDAAREGEIADRINLAAFPKIILYVNKERKDYDIKEITADRLVRFIDKTVRPPSAELIETIEIEGLKSAKGIKSILISDSQDLRDLYIEVAKEIKEIPFYHVTETRGKKYFQSVKTAPAVVLLNDKESEEIVLSSNLTKEGIAEFIKLNMFAAVTPLTKEAGIQILQPNGRIGIIFFIKSDDSHYKEYLGEFQKVAAKHKSLDKLFIVADFTEEIQEKLFKFFNYDKEKIPFIGIVKKDTIISKYEYTGPFTAEGIEKLIEDYKAGKLLESIKSEDEPAENKGPVYKVVGRTFKREVIDSDMNVFVKFYATWCGHCKALAPIFEELAERLQGNKIRFVEIDAALNEIPGHQIASYPTLKYFSKVPNAIPEEYLEARDFDSMLAFLERVYDGKLILSEPKQKQAPQEATNAAEGSCDASCKDKPQ